LKKIQPAIILIDHGHFQYNTVSMGLALWSFHFMTKGFDDKTRVKTDNDVGHFSNCVAGSIFFCLALNFKQMTLYYAPAVFAYLLGRCFVRQNIVTDMKRSTVNGQVVKRFAALGVTVILTFLALWWPFVVYTSSYDGNASVSHRLLHIVGRIFPFQRGLFEGKVSNLWCTLSIKPVSIRRRLPEDIQPLIALAVTFLLILPACIKLFFVGRDGASQRKTCNAHLKTLLWGSMSTSLSFFLASFQVHEKSILITLAPASLLIEDATTFVSLLSVVSVWTLWPLIQTDRLQVAYVACTVIFLLLLILRRISIPEKTVTGDSLESYSWGKAIAFAFSTVMIGLHVLEICISPPAKLPDLFPVLWSIFGCGYFCLAWCMTCWRLFSTDMIQMEPMKHTKKAQ
jgi:alpha-1,3-glucosyltransferase